MPAAAGAYPGASVPGATGAVTHDPVADATALRAAMKGLGTDEDAVIRVLGHRNPAEIEAIKSAYATKIGRDLLADVKSETGGNFQRVLVGLLKDPRHYDADILHEAMKGAGTDEKTLTFFLVGRDGAQKQKIIDIYAREHGKSLQSAVASEVSGDFKKFLVGLCNVREPEGPANEQIARGDAERLYSAGEGKLGTDEATFIDLFTRRSLSQLRQVFAIYETIHKHHTMERAIESEFSGDLKRGLLGVCLYARNPAEYWADVMHNAMKGLGTNDDLLIHAIVSNRDNITNIKHSYAAKYKRSLHQAVSSETSGDYKKSLLAIIGA